MVESPLPPASKDRKADQSQYDDEVSPWEIFETLQRRWRSVLGFTVGVPALAVAISLVLPKQFEAVLLLQVARVGKVNETGSTSPVERNSAVIERLETSAFASRISEQIGTPISMKAREPKGSDLVLVNIRAKNPTLAKQAAKIVMLTLVETHAEPLKAAVDSLSQSLARTRVMAADNAAMLEHLRNKTAQTTNPEPSMTALLLQTQGQLLTQQDSLDMRLLRLELALSPLNTNPTQAIEEIATHDVTPNIWKIAGVFLVVGAFIGVLIALLMQAWSIRYDAQSKRAQRSALLGS